MVAPNARSLEFVGVPLVNRSDERCACRAESSIGRCDGSMDDAIEQFELGVAGTSKGHIQ